MVEIKCNPPIKSRSIGDFKAPDRNLTFPTGEAEYSIYRSPDGRDDNIKFQGIGSNSLFTEFGIQDPKNRTNLQENPIEEETSESFYSPRDSKITSVAQSAYGNPAYWKCVKKQYALQFCDYLNFNTEVINGDQLKEFIRSRLQPDYFEDISESEFTKYETTLLETSLSPYDALRESLANGIEFRAEYTGFGARDKYNNEFYSEIITEEQKVRYGICTRFRSTGVIDKGNLFQLDLSICDRTGQLPDLRIDNGDRRTNVSLLDTVPSENLSFSLSEHRNNENFRTKSNIIFRNTVIDTEFSLLGKEGEREPTRIGTDVRFKDYQIDEYNVPQQ